MMMHVPPSYNPSPGKVPKGFTDVWRMLLHPWPQVRAAAAEVLVRARALLGSDVWLEVLEDLNGYVCCISFTQD